MYQPVSAPEYLQSTYDGPVLVDGIADEPAHVGQPISNAWLAVGVVVGVALMTLLLYAMWSRIAAFQL